MREPLFKFTKINKNKIWTSKEDSLLLTLAERQGERKQWSLISQRLRNKSASECYLRYRKIRPISRKERGVWKKISSS
jgi:hypothetical protein